MKTKILFFIIANVICLGAFYLMFSFILFSANISDWGYFTRASFVSIIGLIETKIIDFIIKELWKKEQ